MAEILRLIKSIKLATQLTMVPQVGLEPTMLSLTAFETAVFANLTTRAKYLVGVHSLELCLDAPKAPGLPLPHTPLFNLV